MEKRFYVTTAIDYVNAEPHIGHTYQKVIADVLARYHKINGEDVWSLTGTDEHGKKISLSAKRAGMDEKQFVDKMSDKFKEAWSKLNLKFDRFIRTTDPDHKQFVQEFVKKVNENGDIYKGQYEGFYCVGCEAYYTEKDLINGECPIHKRKVELLKEETYFFKLSKYQKPLLDLYKSHPEFILPNERRNEIINRVKEGLQDLSITRTNFTWGIPFPLDKQHVIYVWFDALINYMTGAGNRREYWPADVHLLGKDNGWFHAVIWPAMLLSAGYKLPKTVFIHGFLTVEGQKISKSLGNVISPIYLTDKYSIDAIRYFLCRNFPFGQDGDFSEKALVDRNNNELANKFGNLVSRVTALAYSHGIEKCENKLIKKLKLEEVKKNMENFELDKALNHIFEFIDICNEYVQDKKPWETKDKKVLYELIDSIKAITILLYPFIPQACEIISKNIGFDLTIKQIDKQIVLDKIAKSEVLFKKIEFKDSKVITTNIKPIEIKQQEAKINKPQVIEKKMEGIANIIQFPEWQKLDLRVGEIEEVDDIQGADKLYKLKVNIGKENRTICAGLKQFYSKDDLKGKRVIVFTNLAPRVMKGIESKGMLLAAVNKDETSVSLIQPDSEIDNGSRVM